MSSVNELEDEAPQHPICNKRVNDDFAVPDDSYVSLDTFSRRRGERGKDWTSSFETVAFAMMKMENLGDLRGWGE